MKAIQNTSNSIVPAVVRVIVALPILIIGVNHLVSPEAAMQPLLEAAGLPLPALTARVAPVLEILGAVSLLTGAFSRVGALLLSGAMAAATATHLIIAGKGLPWPNGEENDPGTAVPALLLVGAVFILWKGAGRWSLDRKATQ
ncbi:MAG: DoxX family protein [Verrucomicrobiota bacterium]